MRRRRRRLPQPLPLPHARGVPAGRLRARGGGAQVVSQEGAGKGQDSGERSVVDCQCCSSDKITHGRHGVCKV